MSRKPKGQRQPQQTQAEKLRGIRKKNFREGKDVTKEEFVETAKLVGSAINATLALFAGCLGWLDTKAQDGINNLQDR